MPPVTTLQSNTPPPATSGTTNSNVNCSTSANTTTNFNCYELLTPLTGPNNTTITTINTTNPLPYIVTVAEVCLSLGVVLAVFFIVYGGIIKMTTDNINSQKEGNAIIKRTIFGLLLLVFSYILITTINPNLLIDPFPLISTPTTSTNPTTPAPASNQTVTPSTGQATTQ